MVDSTRKLGELIGKSDSEIESQHVLLPVEIDTEDENEHIRTIIRAPPSNAKFSIPTKRTLGVLLQSRNSLRIDQGSLGQASIFGVSIQKLCANTLKIGNNVYEIFDKLYKALSSIRFSGTSMKNDSDIINVNKILSDFG